MSSFLALSLTLVGCGDTSENGAKTKDTKTEQAAEELSTERILTDAMGHEVTIPAKPERIIASYLEDNLVALDITPLAQWTVNDGASIQNYLQDYLKDVPTIPYDLPFEVVTSFSPDLLVMSSAEAVEGGNTSSIQKLRLHMCLK